MKGIDAPLKATAAGTEMGPPRAPSNQKGSAPVKEMR
jgi:hypothetical protein